MRRSMPTEIHFVRRDQNFAVQEELQAVAAAAARSGPMRLTSTDGDVVFVNWANVLYVESMAVAVPASDSTNG
jgi:hypothetical protein